MVVLTTLVVCLDAGKLSLTTLLLESIRFSWWVVFDSKVISLVDSADHLLYPVSRVLLVVGLLLCLLPCFVHQNIFYTDRVSRHKHLHPLKQSSRYKPRGIELDSNPRIAFFVFVSQTHKRRLPGPVTLVAKPGISNLMSQHFAANSMLRQDVVW